MGTRTFFRRGLCPLVAGLATGCATLSGRVPEPPANPPPEAVYPLLPPAKGKSAPDPTDHSVSLPPSDLRDAPEPPARPGPVVTVEAVTAAAQEPTAPPAQACPAQPPAGNGNPPLQPPRPLPPSDAPPNGGPAWRPAGPAGPHVRATPTAAGARLGLAPWEVPADRVVDLSKQLDVADAHHQQLLNRIRELEGLGVGREQALAEAFREAEAAAAEVARTREQLREMRFEVLTLRAKVRQLEEEDIATLRAVIAALDRLLPPPPSRRD